jgi:hypothetical protein
MQRPSFQFYPGDWRKNTKLRRCSWGARGVWIEVLGTLHDSDEYGIVRYPLRELAQVACVPLKLIGELARVEVLKGTDQDFPGYSLTPTHAGKKGEPVMLIAPCKGPVWFCSRMVDDEWRRSVKGLTTRFQPRTMPDTQPTTMPWDGDTPSHGTVPRQGYGSSTSSSTSEESQNQSSSPTRRARKNARAPCVGKIPFILPDWVPKDAWEAFAKMRKAKRAPLTADAVKLIVGKLDKLRADGHDPRDVLNESTAAAWSGVFPPKGNHNGNGRRPTNFENLIAGGRAFLAEYDLGEPEGRPAEGSTD